MDKIPNNYYFTKKEQQAVVDYNNTSDPEQKELIYNIHIHPAISKIAECVAHRFRFEYARTEQGDENLVKSAVAHLATIIPQYDIKRGKAYSFFSFCCKNFLIQENEHAWKRTKTDVSLTPEDEHNPVVLPKNLICEDDCYKEIDLTEFMMQSAIWWETKGIVQFKKQAQLEMLNGIIALMKDPGCIDYPGKVGKKTILEHLRTTTGYKTQAITHFLKYVKPIQHQLLKEYLKHGTVTGNEIKYGRWDWKSGKYVIL